jgi:hypothetical protein
MKVVAILQALMSSTRLSNKVIKPVVERPMIELLLTRLRKSKELKKTTNCTYLTVLAIIRRRIILSHFFIWIRYNDEYFPIGGVFSLLKVCVALTVWRFKSKFLVVLAESLFELDLKRKAQLSSNYLGNLASD